ncbi:hypothetical protein SNE26_20530 [Mucilaginibacter sp. cycad4]|uniref:hypothetical protein n=1 Tax=Mucilaginibacter sp. cycad4 TaxID=3342096 RepID=UPI002AAC3F27|nr:hypothetical protein [Mucilaginibacter gossypii]WPU98415.1 hypothetical protein SNE26_20530 [Mucilaginibacter gossypii]
MQIVVTIVFLLFVFGSSAIARNTSCDIIALLLNSRVYLFPLSRSFTDDDRVFLPRAKPSLAFLSVSGENSRQIRGNRL